MPAHSVNWLTGRLICLKVGGAEARGRENEPWRDWIQCAGIVMNVKPNLGCRHENFAEQFCRRITFTGF
eukprot:2551388-Pleurochrysis_carterae.AAC.1